MNTKTDGRNPLRILHLEDSPLDAELIREQLVDAGLEIQLDWAANEREFTGFLEKNAYDLVLADYRLPGFDAPAALLLTKARCPGMPFIAVTGAVGEEEAVELLKLGATDYVLKDRLVKLPQAIERALAEVGEQQARQRAEEELHRLNLELRESEAKYRSVVAAMAEGVLFWAADGEVTFVNPTAERILGLTGANLTGQTSAERIRDAELVGEDGSVCPAELLPSMLTLRTGEPQSNVVLGIHKPDGPLVWISINSQPLISAGETTPHAVVTTFRDITEHKAAEDRIRQDAAQQATLRELLEITLSGAPLEKTLMRCLEELPKVSWLRFLPQGAIFLTEMDGQTLRLAAAHNLAPEMESLCARIPYGHCLCGRVAATGETQYLANVDDKHEVTYPGMPNHGHYGLPLMTNGQVVGVLMLFLPPEIAPEPAGEDFLASVANILAGYISRKAGEQAITEHQIRLEDSIKALHAAQEVSEEGRRDLDRRQAQLRATLDNTPNVAIQWYDEVGRVVDWNSASERLFGWSYAEAVGKTLDQLSFTQEETESFLRILRSVRTSRGPYGPVEMPIRTRAGDHRLMLETIFTIPMSEGHIGFVSMGVDISELVRVTDALAEHQRNLEDTIQERTASLKASEARTRAIVTTMLDSVIQIDSGGTMLFVNVAAQWMFGYAEEEMVGRNVTMLMPASHASRHSDYLSRYVKTHPSSVVGKRREVEGRRKDGSVFPLELAVNEMAGDEASTFIGVMHDLTSQKKVERELTDALGAAQTAAEAKSRFLANMSHEIRTPMNAVLGLARIGARDHPEGERGRLFTRIHDSGRHLLRVIDDILDFSKIEAGKLEIAREPLCLSGTIDRVVDFVSMSAEAKGLTLSVSTTPDLPEWVSGDSLRLVQILTNLLSNAIKFTERGSVTLSVAHEGEEIAFRVVDSGIGLSEEQLTHLFQPFEQADSTTTRNYGGTGLGLVISKNLARLMGGDISVVSHPGKGSSFTLRLPMPAAVATQQPTYPTDALAAPRPRLEGLSVLAADDVEVNRMILEDMLGHEGARVVFVHDGVQVLKRLEEAGPGAFDVVLMDVQMPVMDGLEATRRIAKRFPGLPVIGLTAHALSEEQDKCFAAGMVDHVTKPVDHDVLVTAILRQIPSEASDPVVSTATVAMIPATTAIPAADTPLRAGCDDARIIDLSILSGRVGSDPAKIDKYAGLFVETADATMTEMQAALAAEDLHSLGGLAHRMKSTALTVGAMRFGEICGELEGVRESKDLAAAHARVGQLRELLSQIAERLEIGARTP